MSKPKQPKKPSESSQSRSQSNKPKSAKPSGSDAQGSRSKSGSKRKAKPGAPLRRALDDLAATTKALDEARSTLRHEREACQEDRQRNAELIRKLRRQLHQNERDLEHARTHVAQEREGREASEAREIEALRRAEEAARTLAENNKELEQLRTLDTEAIKSKVGRIEELEAELAEAQARVKRTEAAHGTIRERVVSLERELSQARTRAVELTQSRDEERRERGKAEAELSRMERELADAFDRSEDLLRKLNTATRIEHGLQRYADKKEGQVVSAERVITEASHRLERIGNDIAAARKRMALPLRRESTPGKQAQAGLG